MAKGDEKDKINWLEPPKPVEELPAWARPERPDLAMPDPALPDMSVLDEVARRQQELNHTEAVARGTAIEAARGVLDQHQRAQQAALDDERRKMAPFNAYLDSLRELAEEGQEDARTELKLQLFRLEGTRGPNSKKNYCMELTMDQAEVRAMGDPDFESRTQDYAERAGRFGCYQWRMKGWACGELTLDTTYTVNVEPPPGYVPPINPIPEEKPKVDPMESMSGTLDFVGRVAALFGGGKSSGMDPVEMRKLEALAYDQGHRAGMTEGKYQAEREHRKELDDLRDRHRKELEDAERRGLDRGKIEGAREVKDELNPKIWQLEHQVASEAGPSLASEVVGYLGGPEAVQALVGAVVSHLSKPKAPGAPPAQRRPAQPTTNPPPPPAQARPAALNPSSEPTRAEHLEAMNMLGEAMAVIEEKVPYEPADHAAQLYQLNDLLAAFHEDGMRDGPLVAWWAEWNGRWKHNVEAVLKAAEEPAGEEPEPVEETVNLDALRALLIEALDQGKDDAAILAYLESTIPAEIRAGWRQQIEGWPVSMVAGMIGQGQHQERLAGLLEAFKTRL